MKIGELSTNVLTEVGSPTHGTLVMHGKFEKLKVYDIF